MPLFLRGNSTPTIPHCPSLRNLQRSKFPYSCADVGGHVAKESGRKGSNDYEVNQWLWRFGRGKPRLGGLSVSASETEERRMAVMQEGARRGHATRPKGGVSEARNEIGLTR